jgi:hypothetical protein
MKIDSGSKHLNKSAANLSLERTARFRRGTADANAMKLSRGSDAAQPLSSTLCLQKNVYLH